MKRIAGFGNMLSLATAPTVQPVTLAELKMWSDVTYTDDDALLAAMLAAAVTAIDGPHGMLGKCILSQQWRYDTYACGRDLIMVPIVPATAIASVQYYDTDNALQTATAANFQMFVSPDRTAIEPKVGYSWPTLYNRPDALRITLTAGMATTAENVPANLKTAIKALAAHWYANREAASADDLKAIPFGVEAMINLHRTGFVGA
jgi:uncharacterized phiE125 gp8 family phage protein